MATGNLYTITDVQTLQSQQVLNVYVYKQLAEPSAGTSIASLVNAFIEFVAYRVQNLQTAEVHHEGLYVINLDNPDEFALIPIADDGNVSGETLPPFAAWAFRLNRTSRAVRNGQKRIAGIPESYQQGGYASATADTAIAAYATILSAILVNSVDGGSFQPRILHKATTAGVGGATETTPRADYAVGSAQYTAISTQNTRKFGRGA